MNRYGKLEFSSPRLELNQSNKIQDFTIDSGCCIDNNVIGSVYVKKLEAHLIDALDDTIENREFNASVGVSYIENEEEITEYINLGSYIVEKPKDEQTENFSSFVAYDTLINHIDDVYSTSLDYGNNTITIGDIYIELCENMELTPTNTVFTNSTLVVENNPFTNNEKNRDVLTSIAKVACAYVDIDEESGEIDLKWFGDEIDYTFQKMIILIWKVENSTRSD